MDYWLLSLACLLGAIKAAVGATGSRDGWRRKKARGFIPPSRCTGRSLSGEGSTKLAVVKPRVTRQLDLMAPLFGVKGWKHSY